MARSKPVSNRVSSSASTRPRHRSGVGRDGSSDGDAHHGARSSRSTSAIAATSRARCAALSRGSSMLQGDVVGRRSSTARSAAPDPVSRRADAPVVRAGADDDEPGSWSAAQQPGSSSRSRDPDGAQHAFVAPPCPAAPISHRTRASPIGRARPRNWSVRAPMRSATSRLNRRTPWISSAVISLTIVGISWTRQALSAQRPVSEPSGGSTVRSGLRLLRCAAHTCCRRLRQAPDVTRSGASVRSPNA